jgi:DNA-binding NtrC family response regulator
VLDDGEYHRLGEGAARRSDFRLVAATNRDATELKRDLLARFVLRIEVPPLGARREDIPLLVRHIVQRAAGAGDEVARALLPRGDPRGEPNVKPSLVRALLGRRYELNVRELESTLWSQLAARSTLLAAPPPGHAGSVAPSEPATDEELAAERIQRCLDEHNGVLELTWRALGMKNRFALLRAIKKHGLVIRKQPGKRP